MEMHITIRRRIGQSEAWTQHEADGLRRSPRFRVGQRAGRPTQRLLTVADTAVPWGQGGGGFQEYEVAVRVEGEYGTYWRDLRVIATNTKPLKTSQI